MFFVFCHPLPASFLWSAKLHSPNFLIFELDINIAFDVHIFIDLLFYVCMSQSTRTQLQNHKLISFAFIYSFISSQDVAVLSELASVLLPQSAREQEGAIIVCINFLLMPLQCSCLPRLPHFQSLRRQLTELLLNCIL